MSYFYDKFENESLNKIYELLADVTPLAFDCGKLCSGRCCKGGDNDGMLLFPGEECLFENRNGFHVYFDERYGSKAVSCSGECLREERPLSCRIFPYMFYSSEKNGEKRITVAPDIRAGELCDILKEGIKPQNDFMRRMRMAAKKAESDKDITEFIERITAILTDFGNL